MEVLINAAIAALPAPYQAASPAMHASGVAAAAASPLQPIPRRLFTDSFSPASSPTVSIPRPPSLSSLSGSGLLSPMSPGGGGSASPAGSVDPAAHEAAVVAAMLRAMELRDAQREAARRYAESLNLHLDVAVQRLGVCALAASKVVASACRMRLRNLLRAGQLGISVKSVQEPLAASRAQHLCNGVVSDPTRYGRCTDLLREAN